MNLRFVHVLLDSDRVHEIHEIRIPAEFQFPSYPKVLTLLAFGRVDNWVKIYG